MTSPPGTPAGLRTATRTTARFAAGWLVDRPLSVAQSVPELPTGADWSYEMKLDGSPDASEVSERKSVKQV